MEHFHFTLGYTRYYSLIDSYYGDRHHIFIRQEKVQSSDFGPGRATRQFDRYADLVTLRLPVGCKLWGTTGVPAGDATFRVDGPGTGEHSDERDRVIEF